MRHLFDVQGHRGAKGLRPENSLAGIACALELGVGSIECDVVLTPEGEVVLSHERLPHRAGPVAAPHTARATLDGALRLFEDFGADDVRLDVEIKSARHSDPAWDAEHVVDRVLADIHAHGAVEQCSVRSFDLEVLHQARAACPGLARCLLVGTVAHRVPAVLAVPADARADLILAMAAGVQACALAPAASLVSADLVRGSHAEAMPVVPWTVNQRHQLRWLISLDVDGVCTDRPDLVRDWLTADGIGVPAALAAPW